MSNTLKLLNAYYENDPLYTAILTLETVQSLYSQLMSINPNISTTGICDELYLPSRAEIRLLTKTIYGAARRRLWAFCLSVLEEMVEDQSWANKR